MSQKHKFLASDNNDYEALTALFTEDTGAGANMQLPDPSLLSYYKDIHHRTYWLNDDINRFTFDLVQYIIQWNREDKGIPVEMREPIKIIVDCDGGHLTVSETISDIIHLSKTPVYGIALGTVASGASLIYLSCHKRFALPSTVFVLHKGSCSGLNGSYAEIEAFMADYKIQIKELMNFYCKHTTFSEDEIEKNMQTDWYVRVQEAKDKGMVDEIITDMEVFC